MPDGSVTDTPILSEQLCFALYATSRAFTKAYAALLEELGVTYPQYLVLLVLWEKGPRSVHQIAEELEIEGPTATPMIKRMEALGLVERKRGLKDERVVFVSTTNRADSLRAKAASIPEKLACAVGVKDAQAQRLLEELNSIRQAID